MPLNRREFIKTLGVAGAGLTGISSRAATDTTDTGEEFYAILHDITLCEGCQECEFACAANHGLPEPEDYPDAEVIRSLDPSRRSIVNAIETPDGEYYTKKQCMNCAQPACASACLTKAMKKEPEGPVTWNEDKCMGCRYCMVSCPFEMPQFEYASNNPRITKCDMCFERTKKGELPACVENCPAGALTYGKRSDILKEARQRILDNPGTYVDHIYGEHEAGGTGWLNLSPVPFEELGFNTAVEKSSYPALTKGFLYSVPSVFVLWPALLIGLKEAVKGEKGDEDHE